LGAGVVVILFATAAALVLPKWLRGSLVTTDLYPALFDQGKVGPKARRTKAIADMEAIHDAAMMLRRDTGLWPETIQEMVNAKHENGTPAVASLEAYPTDPWGNDYVYTVEKDEARVMCLGSDGQEGGEGEAADLVYPAPDATGAGSNEAKDGVDQAR